MSLPICDLDSLNEYVDEALEVHGNGPIATSLVQACLLVGEELGELPPTNADHDKLMAKIGACLTTFSDLSTIVNKTALYAEVGEMLVTWASAKTRKEAEDLLSREEWTDGD